MPSKINCLLIILLLVCGVARAQQRPADAARFAWWHQAKFGMFINWGVHSLYGSEYNGHQQARGGAEWIMNRCKIPVAEYRAMAKQFNPVNYDPDDWAKMAWDAGMKYLVISMKYHDGFALFESKSSNWNVVDATPYGKDLLKPLAKACKKYGIKLGIYYSQAVDWTNPGGAAARRLMKEGWPNPDSAKIDQFTNSHDGQWDPAQLTATFDEYIDRVAAPQIKELLTNSGDIAVLWWDYGTQMKSASGAAKLQKLMALQPNIITNDRLHPNLPGDIKTPEQAIPDRDAVRNQNWETCMTMNNSWGYRKSDNNWKSPEMLIRNLVRIAARGGNYLLNIGPKPDGSFPEESIQRLKVIGSWMKINGEAIYGTQAGPIPLLTWGECTKKVLNGRTILYLSVFTRPANSQLLIPGLKNSVLSAKLLSTGAKLKTVVTVNGLQIYIPDTPASQYASVIKLEVKGDAVTEETKSGYKKMES